MNGLSESIPTPQITLSQMVLEPLSGSSIRKPAISAPRTCSLQRSGLKVSLVRAPPRRALLGVLAVKYETTEAHVPYLYAYICARALFPKTAGLSTRSWLLASRSRRLRARRGDALMRHEVSCLLDLKSVFTHCPSATAAAARLGVSQRSSSLKKHG